MMNQFTSTDIPSPSHALRRQRHKLARSTQCFFEAMENRTLLSVYSNSTAITIPESTSGPATLYPSTINVSGFSGNLADVNVTLSGLYHTYPSDISVLLVSPNGQKVILMSDCGGGNSITGVNLTFDDASGAYLSSNKITSGAYKPTGTADSLPAPAPASPYFSVLSAFNGFNPNGNWTLFVSDAYAGDGGGISLGWSLDLTGNVPTPDINVQGNNIDIADGDTSPDLTDNTTFLAPNSTTPVAKTFVIQNTGTGDLILTGTNPVSLTGAGAGFFSIVQPAKLTLVPGASTTFQVTYSPAGNTSPQSVTLNIASNDPNENPYDFALLGKTPPDINVQGNNITIVDGDATPDLSDLTQFSAASGSLTHTFVIQNTGSSTLSLTGSAPVTLIGVGAPSFTITQPTNLNIAPGASTTFKITYNPSGVTSNQPATVYIASNDPDENPYDFIILGMLPGDINVQGNNLTIADGDTSPSLNDLTLFLAQTTTSDPISHTFVIQNLGIDVLTLTDPSPISLSGPGASHFTVTQPSVLTLASGAFVTFEVSYNPAGDSADQAVTLSIASNDPDENPYDFALLGTIPPDINVQGNDITIPDGDTSPSLTDLTRFSSDTGALTHTFIIQNTSTTALNLSGYYPVTLSGMGASSFNVTQPESLSIAPGESTSFKIIFFPAGLTTNQSATVSIASNDPDENPYDFVILGNAPANISVQGDSVNIPDGDTTPDTADFTSFVVSNAQSAPIVHTFVIKNTGADSLTLAGPNPITLTGDGASHFTITQPTTLTLASGDTVSFQIAFDPAGDPASQSAIVNIASNDPDKNPFDFAILGKLPAAYYVDANATGPTFDGKSWATAFQDLQQAIAIASPGEFICVADGVYKPTGGSDRAVSFVLKNGVQLYGGYAGFGAANPNARDTSLYPTILSGDIGTPGVTTDNSYHVLTASGVGSSTLLDGLTIALGNANGDGTNQNLGGGMLNLSSSSPTLNHCVFTLNSTSSYGAGIYNSLSSPILTNCVFSGNISNNHGGGIYNDRSSPTLINCVFAGNAAGIGGGIYNSQSSPSLVNCTFTANSASTSGPGIYNFNSSSPTLANCILWNNGAASIVNNSSAPIVSYCNVESGYDGTNNINVDPRFVRSPWIGADAAWGTADDDYGDLRLRSSSPCLNVGFNSANAFSTDLAGNPRVQNTTIDLGAYEGAYAAPAQKTIYVDVNANGLNSGSSWANAFVSLQSAILAASDGDSIKIADGTYKPTPTANRTLSFVLKNAVSIQGGYAGFGAENPNAQNPSLYPTLLSGDIGTANVQADNSYHVVVASSVNSSAILDGLTITLGSAKGSGTNQNFAGGMLILSASPTIANCAFSANAANYGGGIYSFPSSILSLDNCSFSKNTSSINGAGIYNLSLSSSIANTSFSENVSGNAGGGIFNNSALSLSNCSFSQNSAPGGAGIYNSSSLVALINCSFTRNSSSSHGAGIYNDYYASPTLANCSFIGNSAFDNGGAIYNYRNCSPTLTNCSFFGNSASFGGAISNYSSSSPILTNCIFASNYVSDFGGALYNYYSSPTLTNCTITGNTDSNDEGGGLFNEYKSSPTITNSILWENGALSISNDSVTSNPIITYTDIQDGYAGTANIDADPLFIRLPSVGADSKWGTADDDYGDLRLQITSPCVNAGLNSANTLPADFAGNRRIINATIDLGAYETLLATPISGSSADDVYVAKLSADGLFLQIWTSADTSGAPAYSISTSNAISLNLASGADTLLLDISTGANLSLTLSNIENIQLTTPASANLALSTSAISVNSTLISCSGASSFQLNTLVLNSLSLTGAISLKLAAPNLIVNSGNVSTLRTYLANTATGAKPSIACDSASSLALLDNSKLHKTAFAGESLSSPFSQLLIQGALPADANLDGKVDQNDLLPIFANLNKPNATWLNGDVNQDGTVDLTDLALVQSKLSAPAKLVLKTAVKTPSKNKSALKTPSHKPKLHYKQTHKAS